MIKRIKKIRNVSLVIILIILILTSIVLGVIKLQNNEKETSSDTLINHEIKQEESAQEVIEEEEEIIDLVEDEEIEEEQEEIQEKSQEESAGTKYFIRVNYGQNVVTVYTKDSNGEYTIPVKAMVCSTGRAATFSPILTKVPYPSRSPTIGWRTPRFALPICSQVRSTKSPNTWFPKKSSTPSLSTFPSPTTPCC